MSNELKLIEKTVTTVEKYTLVDDTSNGDNPTEEPVDPGNPTDPPDPPPTNDVTLPIQYANGDVKMTIDLDCAQPDAEGIVDSSQGVTLMITNLEILNPNWTWANGKRLVNLALAIRSGRPNVRIVDSNGVDDFPDGEPIMVDLLQLVRDKEAKDGIEYYAPFSSDARLKIWCGEYSETAVYLAQIFPLPGGQFVRE
jgi:hypothetical protein